MKLTYKNGQLFFQDLEVTKHFKINEINIDEDNEALIVCEIKVDVESVEVEAELCLMLKGMSEKELLNVIEEAKRILN